MSRIKRFELGRSSGKGVKASNDPDESIAASNASGYPPAVFCLLGNIPNPLFSCFARLRIRLNGDAVISFMGMKRSHFHRK